MTIHPKFKAAFLVLAVLSGYLVLSAGDRGLPAQYGIRNFDKVSDQLFRGAQPDDAGVRKLGELGIKTIINLRAPDKDWATEEAAARSNGIVFTNIPMNGLSRPTDKQIATVLSLIETLPGPVFVHCEYGCDRTGTVVACYRIRHEQWSAARAQEEANLHGMSSLERGMKAFIADFAKATSKK